MTDPEPKVPRKQTLTDRLSNSLRTAIVSGEIEPGTVLTEIPLAELVGSSRVPVRSALHLLMSEGLVHRVGARGYIVGPTGVEMIRAPLGHSLRSLSILHEPRINFAWQTLYDDVEARVVHRSFFGRSRINEHELARHYNVGRTVARDVLSRLETLGMIEKDDASRWSIVPLDEGRIRELYEIREHLEPVAIVGAIGSLGESELQDMTLRHAQGLARYPDISAAEMYELEVDLHVSCIQRTKNSELVKILQRTHCVLTLSKHTVGARVAKLSREGLFEEHMAVFAAMRDSDHEGAREATRRHIRNSVDNVVARALMVRRDGNPEAASFFS